MESVFQLISSKREQAMFNKQRSLQNELIFRLLLKITVERLHECFYFILFARKGPW